MIHKRLRTALTKSMPLRISLLYAAIGGLWILVSDWALHAFVPDPAAFIRLEMLKGWAYVAVTAAILYLLVRHFEKTNREHEQQYRILLEQASDGIYIFDQQGKFLSVNARACELLGYAEAELLQLSITDTFLPEDLIERPVRFPEMMEGRTVRTDRRLRRKDGTLFPAELSAKMVKNDLFLAIVRDVTDRRQAELSLRESEARYHSLFEHMLDGFAYCRMIFENELPRDFVYLSVNNAFGQLTGLKDVVGKKVTEVIPGIRESNPELFEIYGRVSTTGKPERFEQYLPPLDIWLSISVYSTERGYFAAVFDNITDRKQAEEALRASEEKYRLLFHNSPIGIFNYDERLHITDCNDFFLDILDSTREDMIGLDMTLLRDQRPLPAIREALAGGKGVYEGFYRAYPKRPEIYISLRSAPVVCVNGAVQGGVGIVEDITDHVHMEESVQEQKRFAESLIENSAVATFVLDAKHKVVIWNRACEELTGRAAANMLGTDDQWKPFYENKRPTLADVVIDADFDKLQALYSTFATSAFAPNALHAEGWRTHLNGKDRYLLFDAAPIHDGKGALIAAIQTLQDITERKSAEESLQESEQKLQAITDAAVDAIILIDDEERIVYWNPAAAGMFGHQPEEIEGRHISVIIPHRYRERHAQAYNRFARTGQGALLGKTYEVFGLRRDGAEIPIELSISGVRLKGKWHSAGVIRDISERKKLEQQLLHSQKMEAVGQLSGGIAHDFNNILTAIIGYGHILLMKMKEGDPLTDNVRHLLESADRAAHLTHSLLAFSRKQVLNSQPLDLIEVVKRMEKLLKLALGEGIGLETAFKHDSLTIDADVLQIEQVLMNLATNARDAMPQGGSFTIEVDLRELDDTFVRAYGYGEPGRYAVVSVTDTGVGMNEETRKRIFEPFFTTKEVGRGTGLGLSMTYGIIKQHHGYINAYSEPGRGTTFRIYLPLLDAISESRSKKAALPEQVVPGGTETVLIAEDDAALRQLFRAVLEEFGYAVIEAEDGADAVDQFRNESNVIELVILDMIMPRKSGQEAYEEIKKARPGVKALFISGYTADRRLLGSLLEEGTAFVLKPISPKDLLLKVRAVLDA